MFQIINITIPVTCTGSTLCPFCRRQYNSSDVRRIFNDAEDQSETDQLVEIAEQIRLMLEKQTRVQNEAAELKRQNTAITAEREQLAAQTGINNLTVVQSGQGICSNCTRLKADYTKLATQYKTLQEKNKHLTSRVLVADVSSDSDND